MLNKFNLVDKKMNALKSQAQAASRVLLSEEQLSEYAEIQLYTERQAEKRVEIENSIPAGKERKQAVALLKAETTQGIAAIKEKFRGTAAVKAIPLGEVKGKYGAYFYASDLNQVVKSNRFDKFAAIESIPVKSIPKALLDPYMLKVIDFDSLSEVDSKLTILSIRKHIQAYLKAVPAGINLQQPGQVVNHLAFNLQRIKAEKANM